MNRVKQHHLLLGFALLLAALAIGSLFVGSNPIPVVQALLESFSDDQSIFMLILTEVRLPHTIIAIIVGATLGAYGAAMQGLLRNPLASPDLIGSSSGAALGAVIVLYFGFSSHCPWAELLAHCSLHYWSTCSLADKRAP